MHPKVSIIVPIHNAGKHLKKCLDTLIQQTLKEIEIILVLDFPTDGSDQLAQEYAQKDGRIKLIFNKQNLNIGYSRNEGLKIATGDYIGFSDHDDWRELIMYEDLYNKAQETLADVIIGNFDHCYPDHTVPNPPYPVESLDTLKEQIFNHYIGDYTKDKCWQAFTCKGFIWHILYKREVLQKHNLQFLNNNQATFEDLYFIIQVFYFAKKIAYLPTIYYHHLYHETNGANNYRYYSTPLVIGFLENLKLFLQKEQILETHTDDLFYTTLFYLKNSLQNEIKHKSYKSAWNQIKRIRKSSPIIELLKQEKITCTTIKKLKVQKTLLWFMLIV